MKSSLFALAAIAVSTNGDAGASHPVTLATSTFSSDSDRVAPGAIGLAGLQVDGAWMSLESVELRDAPGCEKSKGLRIGGPLVRDLVGAVIAGGPAPADVGEQKFCGMALALRRSRGQMAGLPSELRRHSILVLAHRADGVRVIVRSRSREPIWLGARKADGFGAPSDGATWFIAADLAAWLGAIDLDTADVSHDGANEVIRIDEKSNPELLAQFERAVAGGVGVYVDVDKDGALDADELRGDGHLAGGGGSEESVGLARSRPSKPSGR